MLNSLINNLFSIFDPSSIFGLSLNWGASLGALLIMPTSIWLSSAQPAMFGELVKKTLHAEAKALMGGAGAPGSSMIVITIFCLIALNNFMGLFPYMFTSSSHLWFTLALALPLWLGHISYAWVITPNNMFAHLVPLGTPAALMPFMVIIEMISNLIRPLTLSVRLAANIVAGHLLLSLLSVNSPNTSYLLLGFVLSSLIALSILEMAVAIIQGYVFSTLSLLYINEVKSPNMV